MWRRRLLPKLPFSLLDVLLSILSPYFWSSQHTGSQKAWGHREVQEVTAAESPKLNPQPLYRVRRLLAASPSWGLAGAQRAPLSHGADRVLQGLHVEPGRHGLCDLGPHHPVPPCPR